MVQGQVGDDGFPIVVEYDPFSLIGPDRPAAYYDAVRCAEYSCWDVWDTFCESLEFSLTGCD